MKKIFIFFILFLIQNTVSAKTINWETTRDKIVSHAYQVELSKIDVDISKAKILGAKSEYYPQIGLYAYNEYSKYLGTRTSQVEYIGSEAIYGHDIVQNAVSLGLTYNLYDFGIRGDKLKIAKNENKAKLGTYYKTLRDIELNAIDLYAKALSERKEIEVKSEILKIQNELFLNKDRLNISGQTDKTKVLAENIKTIELENNIEKLKNEHIKTLKDLSHYAR
ncbi:MAG: TolC family protein [Candidatus Gastranaerophilaceae bacterium]